MSLQKLELTWIGKDEKIIVEPRILIENPELSNTTNDPQTENMLIHGDNLLALKALEQEYAGKVKCIYIDPPYNTGSAFEQYDDNLEHSTWLNLMRPRLELLRNLLSEQGAIFISIDDREYAYLKVLCDEVFGRNNYVGDFIWQKKRGGGNDSKFIAVEHEYILCYCRNQDKCDAWHVSHEEAYLKRYSEQDEKGRYFWDTFARPGLQSPIIYEIEAPDGTKIKNGWVRSQERFLKDYEKGEIRIIKKNDGQWSVQFKQYLGKGKKPRSLLTELAVNSDGKKEIESLFGDPKYFSYPKPENLIRHFIECNTDEGDLVLDSFIGSGTTCAVAHKMKRKWIGIEMGDHAYTHSKVRMDKVIEGEQGGISQKTKWQGGGGYKFYELAPTLIKTDRLGCQIINPEYNAEMLALAVAKHEGFNYNPDASLYWKQSQFDNSYLYVTTQHITAQILERIQSEMEENEYLIIATKSFDQGVEKAFKNIRVKKIPQMLLGKCQFGKDDYKLNIIASSDLEVETDEEE